MRVTLTALALAGMLLLSGCSATLLPYAREMGDMALLRTMGVDAGEGDYQVEVTVSTGKRAYGLQGESQPSLVLSAQRESLSAACLAMQGLSDSYVFYGYVDQLLLGEELSQRGVWPVLDYFAQDAQLGLGVQLWVVRGGTAAQAVQAGGESGVENRLSTLQTDSEMGAAGASRTAGEVFSDLLERGSAYLPALRVQETDQEGQTALLEAGYAVLKNGVLAGYLEGESAKGLELLVNQAPSDVLEVPLSQGRVVVRVTGSALVCTPKMENGQLTAVDLNCRVTAEVAEVEGELSQEDLEQVKQAVDSRQQRRLTQALERLQSWGADCVGLGQRLAMADPARGEKLLEQWPEVFSSLPVQVSVETSLTRLLFMEES